MQENGGSIIFEKNEDEEHFILSLGNIEYYTKFPCEYDIFHCLVRHEASLIKDKENEKK